MNGNQTCIRLVLLYCFLNREKLFRNFSSVNNNCFINTSIFTIKGVYLENVRS